ncbi:MAG: GntG family PLP-dependent aldolase [Planctomycetota bacterium]
MKDVIDLRSDTVTKPTPEMRQAIAAAEVGDDVFGEDPTARRLEELAAALLGKEASLFVPSGTMANSIGVRLSSEPGGEMIVDSRSHIYNFECASAVQIAQTQLRPIESERGILDAAAVEAAIRPDDIHQPRTRAVAIENTHNMGGGSVWKLSEIGAVADLAKRHGLRLHMDGARLLNAALAGGYSAAQASERCDTVTLCLSKGLGAPIGSIIAGSREDMKRARRIRKLLGGGMRQVGIIATAGIYALEHNVERLAEDHANAKRIFEELATFEEFDLGGVVVETNILIFSTRRSAAWTRDLVERLAGRGVLINWRGGSRLRIVTNLNVSARDVDRALSALRQAVREGAGAERDEPGGNP